MAEFRRRYRGDGYAMSYVVLTVHEGRLIRLTTDDGQSGLGEIVRWPKLDIAACAAAEDAAVRELEDLRLAELPARLASWRAQGPELAGFCFGVETALLDMLGRASGMPLCALLGGPDAGDAPGYVSIGGKAPEDAAAEVRAKGADAPVVQIKLGVDDIETDMKRVRAALAALGLDQLLLADFNGAWTPDVVSPVLGEVEDPRLMWEDPCVSFEENLAVAKAIKAPVMFDMCCDNLGTIVQAVNARVAAIALKPVKLGSLADTRAARDLCAAAGVRMRIDGPWCGQVAAAAAVHLAIGAPSDLLIASCDLTDPLETERTLLRDPAPGRVGPVAGAGLGLDASAVRDVWEAAA